MAPRRLRIHLLAVTLVGASLFGLPGASAYPASNVEFEGHGWGHGRGMGQWGGLGYAIDHDWGYRKILGHFYGGTQESTMENSIITVRLTRFDGSHTIIEQERGNAQTNAASGTFDALRAVRIGPNTFRVDQGPGCGGPWTTLRESMSGPVVFRPTDRNNDRQDMLQVCEPSGARRWMRGDILSVDADATTTSSQTIQTSENGETTDHTVGPQRTVNRVRIELYLRGVVPQESPPSWGDLDGGAGMHQLRAQAVAARSYGASENRYAYAKTCDSTACQVYGGVAVQTGSTFTPIEHANTTRAIRETAGETRRFSDGTIARTEFSASTGGWTAGGTFPAVQDLGDDICSAACNPHHNWTRTVPVSEVESSWPEIGTLQSISVTDRNGLGDFGGRAVTVRIEGTDGAVTPSGDQVRLRLGLKSNWFRIVQPDGTSPSPEPTPDPTECTITGTDGPDELDGTSGPDVICGLGGDDVIRGLEGDDVLFGGPGNDFLAGNKGNDRIFGGDGDDVLLHGGRGNDEIRGGPGDENDGPRGPGIVGGSGADDLFGDDGRDHLQGGDHDDVLHGGPDPDTLAGNAGDDELYGDGGDDPLLNGGAGDDLVRGGAGDDQRVESGVRRPGLAGGPGNDLLIGDAGEDTLHGGAGFDRLRGGPDHDRCIADASDVEVTGCP